MKTTSIFISIVITTAVFLNGCSLSGSDVPTEEEPGAANSLKQLEQTENYRMERVQQIVASIHEQNQEEDTSLEPGWTDSNEALYEQALQKTDIVFDEENSTFTPATAE